MKYIIYIILIAFLQSCTITNLHKSSKEINYNKVLSKTSETYIYRANLNLYNNDFSGMIIIKPQENNNYRIVFINEVGMKFFDLEFNDETYKINHIFEPMNKKIFLKLLINDFRFILMNNLNSNFKTYKEKKGDLFVIKPKGQKELYYFNEKSEFPKKAIKYSWLRKTVYLTYENYKEEKPSKIHIKHKNIKFYMDLDFLK